MNLRSACLLALSGAALLAAGPASAASSTVAFISLVRGKPALQDAEGARIPMKLMQTLTPGSMLTLESADAVGVCHEKASTSYRIEGAGAVLIETDRIVPKSGNAKVMSVGRCGATANSSETGGVLLRSVQTPK